MSGVLSQEARVGRHKQRYTEKGYREVAGVIPVDEDSRQILLISSRKHPGRWVIPKGGWDNDETCEEAALRETWEEAGVEGTLGSLIYSLHRPSSKVESKEKGTHFQVYELLVTKIHETWPESLDRERRWMGYEEALGKTEGFVHEAIQCCRLSPKRQAQN
ncbi:MAG: NUDIX hydrolase domain-like protein [Piptocephalis tieghemiana]|nr:MAG: NUDIX hydrolase domain-like protein [Piptocephalis tieghemiana]